MVQDRRKQYQSEIVKCNSKCKEYGGGIESVTFIKVTKDFLAFTGYDMSKNVVTDYPYEIKTIWNLSES